MSNRYLEIDLYIVGAMLALYLLYRITLELENRPARPIPYPTATDHNADVDDQGADE